MNFFKVFPSKRYFCSAPSLRRHITWCLFFCAFNILDIQAQIIKDKYYKESTKKWKFIIAFDGRRSFIADQNVKIGGIRIGMQYKNNFRTGIGFYGFDQPIKKPIQIVYKGDLIDAVEVLQYNYSTLFFEPILYRIRRWEFSIPCSIGRGEAKLNIRDSTGTLLRRRSGNTGFFEAAAYAENRIFWWIGMGGGIGYRKVLNTEIIAGKRLNGPYYQLAVKIYFGEIVRRVFSKKDSKIK